MIWNTTALITLESVCFGGWPATWFCIDFGEFWSGNIELVAEFCVASLRRLVEGAVTVSDSSMSSKSMTGRKHVKNLFFETLLIVF